MEFVDVSDQNCSQAFVKRTSNAQDPTVGDVRNGNCGVSKNQFFSASEKLKPTKGDKDQGRCSVITSHMMHEQVNLSPRLRSRKVCESSAA